MVNRALLLFFLSGATSLVYEVLWMRRLSLVFGHSIFSVSTVLTTFMTGLALGSYLGGHWSDRRRREGTSENEFLKTYGKLELFIGAWAVLSLLLLDAVEWGFLSLSRSGFQGGALTVFLFACSFLVLLPPTTAMGATLPIFTQVLVRHKNDTGPFLSKIYGFNTLGACCGAAFGGIVGLPTLGLQTTVLATAVLNAVIAALAYSLDLKFVELSGKPEEATATAPEATPAAAQPPASPAGSRWVPLVFGISGFAGMVYQLGWTRALVLSIGSSTYSFSLILTTFLASLGLGSMLYKRLFSQRLPRLKDLAFLQLFIACSALVVSQGVGNLAYLKIKVLPLLGQSFLRVAAFDTLVVFVLLLLPTLALGLTFPLVTHLYTSRIDELGKRLGEAYAANTTGAIAGSFLGGFVLLPSLGLQNSMELAAGLNLVGGLLLMTASRGRAGEASALKTAPIPFYRQKEAVLALLAIGLLLFAPSWNLGVLSSGVGVGYGQPTLGRGKPLFYRDGVSSTVTVNLSQGALPYIAVNGKTDASLSPADRSTQLLLGLIPAALHPAPHQVAVIGFGSGQTPVALLSVPEVEEVRCAELEPAVLEARKFFSPFSEGALEDPRLKLVEDDGRSFILGSDVPFDLIISEPSNPWMAGIGNLYTKDFYQGCRSQLKEGGIMGQWFHLYAMTPENVQMVYRTFFSVFPHGGVYRTSRGDILLIGSEQPVAMKQERLQKLFAADQASTFWFTSLRLVHPSMLYASYLAERQDVIDYLEQQSGGFQTGPINTDDRPLLEFQAPLNLFSRTQTDLSYFQAVLPPDLNSQPFLRQAAIVGRILLDFPLDGPSQLQQLQQLDPQAQHWYPQLLAPLINEQPVDFESLLTQARTEDRAWLTRLAIVMKLDRQEYDGLAALLPQAIADSTEATRLPLLMAAAGQASRLGELKTARDLYLQAASLTQGDEPLVFAAILGELKDWDEALLHDAISRNPHNASSRFYLATLYAERGQSQEALAQALESYRLFPLHSAVAELLTELYRSQGDAERVLHFAAEARRLQQIQEARSAR